LDGLIGHCRVGHSTDGQTIAWTNAVLDLTALSPSSPITILVMSRSMLEQPDGSLLASGYLELRAEPFRYINILLRSIDGGYRWEHHSVFMRGTPQLGGQGMCEPAVVALGDGELFSVARNKDDAPMYSARSRDGGKTWTPPARLPVYMASVQPDLALLPNGILACSFGRPANKIAFSTDGRGETWTAATEITDRWQPTTGYTGLRAVGPDRLLLVYDHIPGVNWDKRGTPGATNEIWGVFIDVKRR
jgi:hypothetical protein